MTKETFLKQSLLSIDSFNIQKNVGERWAQFNREESTIAIYMAMEGYSKQQSVDFCSWFMKLSTDDLSYYIVEETSPTPVIQYYSRDEMYDKFIEQQNKDNGHTSNSSATA